MKNKVYKYRYILYVFAIIILSICTNFVANPIYSNALLNNSLGTLYDSGLFFYQGNAIKSGMIPYVDFWDHKGILWFILCAIPMSFKDGIRMFGVCSIIYAIINIFIVIKITNYFFEKKSIVNEIVIIILYFGIVQPITVEEPLLLMLNIILLLTLKYINNDISAKNKYYAFFIGLLFALILNIRMKEFTYLFISGLIVLINEFVIKKDYKKFWIYVKNVILGLIIGFLPFIAYCMYYDIISEWFWSNFIYGFEYSSNLVGYGNIENHGILTLIIIFISFLIGVYSIFQYENKKINKTKFLKKLLVFAYGISSLIVCYTGAVSWHYMTVSYTLICLITCMLINKLSYILSNKNKKNILQEIIITFVVCGILYSCFGFISQYCLTVWAIKDSHNQETVQKSIAEIEEIVNTDISNIYAANCNTVIYNYDNSLAKQTYISYTTWWATGSQKLYDQMINDFKNNNYEYILICNKNANKASNKFPDYIKEITKEYDHYKTIDKYEIFKKN